MIAEFGNGGGGGEIRLKCFSRLQIDRQGDNESFAAALLTGKGFGAAAEEHRIKTEDKGFAAADGGVDREPCGEYLVCGVKLEGVAVDIAIPPGEVFERHHGGGFDPQKESFFAVVFERYFYI